MALAAEAMHFKVHSKCNGKLVPVVYRATVEDLVNGSCSSKVVFVVVVVFRASLKMFLSTSHQQNTKSEWIVD